MGTPDPLILFDGVCNLCNSSVLFIIKRDPKGKFKFAPLQSAFARNILLQNGIDLNQMQSIILIQNSNAYQRSHAALEIVKKLNGLWPMLYLFIIVPPFLRDWVYDWISRNRYRIFGKKDECMIPTPELKARFV